MSIIKLHVARIPIEAAATAEEAIAVAVAEWQANPRHIGRRVRQGELFTLDMATEASALNTLQLGACAEDTENAYAVPFCGYGDNRLVTKRTQIPVSDVAELERLQSPGTGLPLVLFALQHAGPTVSAATLAVVADFPSAEIIANPNGPAAQEPEFEYVVAEGGCRLTDGFDTAELAAEHAKALLDGDSGRLYSTLTVEAVPKSPDAMTVFTVTRPERDGLFVDLNITRSVPVDGAPIAGWFVGFHYSRASLPLARP